MKKIILILVSLLSLSFAHNSFPSQPPLEETELSSTQKTQTQVQPQTQTTTSWFSKITTSISTFFSTLASPFTAIKEYFFSAKPTTPEQTTPISSTSEPQQPTHEQIADVPSAVVVPPQTTSLSVTVEEKEEEEKRSDQLLTQHIKNSIKSIHPATNIYSIAYDCDKNRLQLTFPTPNFVRMFYVDFYEATPKKNYFFATKFTTSTIQSVGGSTRQQAYRSLINPIELNQENSKAQDVPKFENVKMYDFSPDEKKIILLTSDASFWSIVGAVKPKKEHENPTGEIDKSGEGIFTYHIYDIASKKIIASIQNALSVSFINDNQIAVYFDDNTSEIRDLSPSWFSFFPKSKQSQPSHQPLIKYYPHSNKLEFTQSSVTIEHAVGYHYSPKRHYVIVEKPRNWATYLYNIANDINQERPIMHLFDIMTGQEKTDLVQFNLLRDNTTNIISYIFNEDETQILLLVKNHCKFILFDITKNQIIEQPDHLQNAQSIYFKNLSEFTIIDPDNKSRDIKIQQQNRSYRTILFQKATDFVSGTKKYIQQRASDTGTAKDIKQLIHAAHTKYLMLQPQSHTQHSVTTTDIANQPTKPAQSIEQRNKEAEEFSENDDEFKQISSEKVKELLVSIKKDCRAMQNADVNSRGFANSLWNKIINLENIIPSCEISQQQAINTELLEIKNQYFPTWKRAINSLITSGWNTHKKTINITMSYLLIPALTAAILPLLQVSTGNATFDSTALLIPAMTSIAATGINKLALRAQLPSNVTVPTTGALTSITRELATTYNKTATLPFPSTQGIVSGVFFATASEVAHKVFAQEIKGAPTLLQQYSKEIIVRDASKPSHNELVNALLPYTKKVISDPKAQEFLAQITYVTGQSMAIGIACYFAGIGYYDETSLAQAVYYAALRGLTSGALAYIATDTTQKTGVLVTTPIDLLATSFVNILAKTSGAPLSPTLATTVGLQAFVRTIIDLLAEKTSKKQDDQQNVQEINVEPSTTKTHNEETDIEEMDIEEGEQKVPAEETGGFINLVKKSGKKLASEAAQSGWGFFSTMGGYMATAYSHMKDFGDEDTVSY